MQQNLEFSDLIKCYTHFNPDHPKIVKATFNFPEFVSTHHKSVYSINSLLSTANFRILDHRVARLIFNHVLPQYTLINF